MSDRLFVMSNRVEDRVNVGAYSFPYSGVGVEFRPLCLSDINHQPTLHEVGYLPNNSNWNFPAVLSPFWRLYYNLDRGHCIWLNDEVYELLPNRLYLIPDHVLFHCLGQQPVRHFWMAFSMPSRVDAAQVIPIELEPQEPEKILIQGIGNHILNHSVGDGTDSLFHEGMALLHLLLARSEIQWRAPLSQALNNLLQFIDLHAHETLPNKRLAAEAGMSVVSLCRAFQAHMHITPAHYVNQVRISKAGYLLEHSELSIDEIAETTGFPNRAYFSRVFKKMTSVSPAAFRKRKVAHRLQFRHG